MDNEDLRHMARALELARQGRYSTQPNPHVGCVIVNAGKTVGEGYHQKAGEPHAEANALREAGELGRGATAYVTLEPCNHTGRTPPCVDQLIAAQVARVVYAVEDPNPHVSGAGANRLREAGIEVVHGVLAEDAMRLNRGFLRRAQHGRPFVTLKIAMSLDAKIGLRSGESKWITGPQARADVQLLRARSCAIVTGSGTVRTDNPKLTVRDPSLATAGRQPRVVVLDSKMALDMSYDVFSGDAQCIVISSEDNQQKREKFAEKSVEVYRIQRSAKGGVDLGSTLDLLGALECNEVLVEAGPQVIGSFISEQLWDEMIVYIAPKIIGESGREGFELPPIAALGDASDVHVVDITQVGADLRLTLTPNERA